MNTELSEPLVAKEGGSFNKYGIWSMLSFSWLSPLLRVGASRRLKISDIPDVPESETAEKDSILLEESIRTQSDVFSLPRAIFSIVWRSLLSNAFFAGTNTITSYIGPLLIIHFVEYMSTKEEVTSSYKYGLTLSLVFFVAKCLESLSQRQWLFGASRVGVRVRAATMGLVYKKSLSLKIGQRNSPPVINLMDVDTERLGDFFSHVHGIWLLPLQVCLALGILYKNLGLAPATAAFLSTVLIMVGNTPLANKQKRLQAMIMEAKDTRINATSETIKNVRFLKFNSWEDVFVGRLLKLREKEKSWLTQYLYTCSTVAFLFWASPALVSIMTFGVCTLVNTPLGSSTILSTLATFRILQEPIYNLPELISVIAQTRVSVSRLEDFLKGGEQGRLHKLLDYSHTRSLDSLAIDVQIGEYSYDTHIREPTIRITECIRVKRGWKVAICGSVGSGKSSLMCSILGEMTRISGLEISVFGSKAFVSQSSWIQTGSIRENILFGKDMDTDSYEEVLEACALKEDLLMWPDSDLCIVGERGINLSGGQKQRIQMARALYSGRDIYFLDDPFSAIDAHTSRHLFKRCLLDMLSEKTVVYITHQLEFLNASDLVLVLKDGRIVESGKYEDLMKNPNGEFRKQMAAHRRSLEQVDPDNGGIDSTVKPLANKLEITTEHVSSGGLIKYDNLEKPNEEEEGVRGRVTWQVYWTFITIAYGGALVLVILLCQVLFQGLQMGSNYWITWATTTEKGSRVSNKKLMGFYILLSCVSCMFILGRTVFLSTIAIETAHRMYLNMITAVFQAPVSFFDVTPSSRILSRAYYITTARELARMVGIRKAPILHHVSESMIGSSTIRCFNQENRFNAKILELINDYSCVTFHNMATMEWLSLRINFLFNLAFFVLLVILVYLPRSAIDPSLSGLAATYGLNMNVLQAWIIWNLCNVENKMISVERILEYAKLPSEAALIVEDFRPESDWPTRGSIQIQDLKVRYSADLPFVLKDITCTIPARVKLGIVGRTGSGKSTLIQALFRMVESTQGNIFIDGLDICRMGLKDLRSKLSVIPQDPTLFQGTIRENLDPLLEHSESEIWEVVNRSDKLAAILRQDHRLLDAPVSEEGKNWSVGQRQLVCLARALLQRRRILVMDEATASVDTETDNLIQKTIREDTGECTVITVAHRIPTVIDYDLIMLLDQGRIVQYDSPAELLKDSSSAFSMLVKDFQNRTSGAMS
ncbi:ABC transporter C family member 3-like isoform X2 [Silene latifolia]|uniref:ABC transporter C family member 3-like isoform X2 n=1 Tax=Silene latifolia TaxID=37657 RepID=UPI003D776E3C